MEPREQVSGRIKMKKHLLILRKNRSLKRWKKLFSQDRGYQDKLYFGSRATLTEDTKQILDSFFEEYETTIPSWELCVVRRFFKTIITSTGNHARSKLDDRDRISGLRRPVSQWLTPQELRESLDFERFDSPAHYNMNADRRLIYIHQLDPQYVLVLARTAHGDQVDALRDTIWKHIAFEASLRVVIPLDGFATFRLELHFPFLTLRDHGGTTTEPLSSKTTATEKWPDLGFLDIECSGDHDGKCRFEIRDAIVSIVICGHDHTRWVGWGLSNTPGDPPTYEEDCELQEDFFAADGNGPEEVLVVDSDSPEWDPRKYWLRNVEIRVHIALKEWKFLVFSIEDSIVAWKNKHRLSRSKNGTNGNREDLKELFEWIVDITQLLGKLSENFSKTSQVRARFNATGGDRDYFADMRDPGVTCMHSSLENSFEGLADLKKKLIQLEKSCNDMQNILALHLEHDSNLVNSDTRELSRQAHSANLQSVFISRDLHRLNQMSTEAAEATTHTTRINVQLFLVTTPFFLALQYFGAEKDIFSFNRNPKTFVVTCIILLCALPLTMYALGHMNRIWDSHRREKRPQDGKTTNTITETFGVV